jgi:hypothetical protein
LPPPATAKRQAFLSLLLLLHLLHVERKGMKKRAY